MRSRIYSFPLAVQVVTLITLLTLSAIALGQKDVGGEELPDRARIKVSLKMEKADIPDILRELFKAAKVNYTIDPGVKGKLSLSFDQVPFRVALETVLKRATQSLTYTVDNGIYSVKVKEKEDDHGLGSDPVGIERFGPGIFKIAGTSLNTSATGIVQRFKERPEIYLSDLLPDITFKDFYFLALPADNSIIVRCPDTPEGEMAFYGFHQRIKLIDVLPREVELHVELVLARKGERNQNHKATMEMIGRTVSEQAIKLRTNTQSTVSTSSRITIRSGTYELHIKPTVNGDESVSLETEAKLDLTFSLPGDSKPQHLHNTFTGGGRYLSGKRMLLASTTFRSQSGQSRADDMELLILVTPVLSK